MGDIVPIMGEKRKVALSLFAITLAVLGILVLPKLPQLVTLLGFMEKPTAGIIQPLEIGQPVMDEIKLREQKVQMVFEAPIHNPNPFPAHIETVKSDIYIEERKVSENNTFGGLQIPSKTTENVKFKASLNIVNSLKATPDILMDKIQNKETTVYLDNVLEVKIGSKKLSIPFNKKLSV